MQHFEDVLDFFFYSSQDINQTMRTDINELYIYSLLANDIDRIRETGKTQTKNRTPSHFFHCFSIDEIVTHDSRHFQL